MNAVTLVEVTADSVGVLAGDDNKLKSWTCGELLSCDHQPNTFGDVCSKISSQPDSATASRKRSRTVPKIDG